MISVIVPLSESRREFFERFCRPSIQHHDYELIVIEGDDDAPRKRNKGASQAHGEFLFFLDDDTILAADCLQELEAAIVGHDFAYCDFDAAVWPGSKAKPYRLRPGPFSLERLRKGNYLSTMSLIRATAFTGWDESLTRYQDWDLFLTMGEQGAKGAYVPKTLFINCAIDAGISTRGNAAKLREVVKRKHRIT